MPRLLSAVLLAIAFAGAPLSAQEPYLKPPAVVEKILDAPRLPALMPSPDGKVVLLAEPTSLPSIADLAQPMLRLAGLRINPHTNGPHSPVGFRALVIRDLSSGVERKVTTPAGARLGSPRWSPDGQRIAFTTTTDKGIDLWVANAATGESRSLTSRTLNAVTGPPCTWVPNSRSLLCQ